MPDTLVTDLSHFLQDGRLHPALPGPARKLVDYLGAIVTAVTSAEPDEPLGVRCRRRPARKPCPGDVEGFIEPESNRIRWICLSCGDNGLISNWENTLWDCSERQSEAHH